MTATVFRQSYMTQRPSLFTLISYRVIVFSFALIFANGWFTACDGLLWCFCLLAESYETINHYHFQPRNSGKDGKIDLSCFSVWDGTGLYYCQ